MNLMTSPSYHQVSPLARSRTEYRGATSMRRSLSFSGGGFTMPQYGYGGGYMSRSLSRSGKLPPFLEKFTQQEFMDEFKSDFYVVRKWLTFRLFG